MALLCLSALIVPAQGQQRLHPRQMYERVMVIVPVVGQGTYADPKRPMYAPSPKSISPTSRTGIIAYTYVLSDDGKFALAEFVARDRTAFNAVLADPTVKSFVKGVSSNANAEAEFKNFKKDFDINKFGVSVR